MRGASSSCIHRAMIMIRNAAVSRDDHGTQYSVDMSRRLWLSDTRFSDDAHIFLKSAWQTMLHVRIRSSINRMIGVLYFLSDLFPMVFLFPFRSLCVLLSLSLFVFKILECFAKSTTTTTTTTTTTK
jgi:hypothetical protein